MENSGWNSQPIGCCVHFVLGEAQIARSHVLHGVKFYFFKAHNLGRHMNFSMGKDACVHFVLLEYIQDLDLGVVDGIRIIIDICLFHIGFSLFVVQIFHKILLSFTHVNGFGMEGCECGGKIHLGYSLMLFGCVDHNEIIRTYAS